MILIGLLGVMIGDSFVYFLGHHFGRKLLKKWPFKSFIDDTKIEKIKVRLHDHGAKVLFSARFMPGVRSTIFFAAGTLNYPYKKLLAYDGGAALISVPAIIYSVYYFGDIVQSVIKWIKKVEGGIIGLIVAVILFFAVKYWLKSRKKAGELE